MNFMKLICENAVTEHSVTFYADYLCVSTKHLTRLTKETFKQTPPRNDMQRNHLSCFGHVG